MFVLRAVASDSAPAGPSLSPDKSNCQSCVVLSAVARETAHAGPGLFEDKSKCFRVVFAVLSAVASDSEPLEEGLNGVNRQPSNGLKFNRKPSTVKNVG